MLINHVNFNLFFKNKELNKKKTWWWEKLNDLNLHIKYKSSKQNFTNDSSRQFDYEINELIIVNAITNDVNKLIIDHVYVQTYYVKKNSSANWEKNDELSSILFLKKKNCQFSLNSKTTNKINIENDVVCIENFKNITLYTYLNFIIKTKILLTKKLVFTIQTKVFHVWFEFRSL
jgi:hypothetical protein